MIVEIELTNGGKATIPNECLSELSKYRWKQRYNGHGRPYAVRNERGKDGKWHTILMHRVIWELINGPIPIKMEIDHIDGNTFNNDILNLRLCTHAQNGYNKHRNKTNCTSKYTGVTKSKRTGRWIAKIKHRGICKTIGTFDIEEDAARAYDSSAKILFGIYAALNFPDKFEEDKSMDEVVIKTTLDKVRTKKVGRGKGGEVGLIYLPKDWQGKVVQVVLKED